MQLCIAEGPNIVGGDNNKDGQIVEVTLYLSGGPVVQAFLEQVDGCYMAPRQNLTRFADVDPSLRLGAACAGCG